MVMSVSILGIVIAYMVMALTGRGHSSEKAIREPTRTIFPSRRRLRRASQFAIVGSGALACLGIAVGPGGTTLFWGSLVFFTISLVSYPSRIIISEAGVDKIWLGGWLRRSIDWREAYCAISDPIAHSVELLSIQGKSITHTCDHVDRGWFLSLLEAHVPIRPAQQPMPF